MRRRAGPAHRPRTDRRLVPKQSQSSMKPILNAKAQRGKDPNCNEVFSAPLRLCVFALFLCAVEAKAWWVTNQFGWTNRNVTVTFTPVPGSRPVILTNGVIIYSHQTVAT